MHPDEPRTEDLTLAAVMAALSDPVRVAIVRTLAADGERTCGTFDLGISKATRSHHFKVLREAGLIRSERRGVEMRSTSRCPEIDKRFPGLIAAIVEAHARQRRLAPRQGPARAKTVRRASA